MNEKEFNEAVGKILGIKSGKVIGAGINAIKDNHLDQRIVLTIKPDKKQAKRLLDLAMDFFNMKL